MKEKVSWRKTLSGRSNCLSSNLFHTANEEKKKQQILPIKTNFWENKTQVGELVRGKKKKKK